MRFKCFRFFY